MTHIRTLLALTTLLTFGAANAQDAYADNLEGITVCFSKETIYASKDATAASPTVPTAVFNAVTAQLKADGIKYDTNCKDTQFDLEVSIDSIKGPQGSNTNIYVFDVQVFDYDAAPAGAIIYDDGSFGFTTRTGADYAAFLAKNIADLVKDFARQYRSVN